MKQEQLLVYVATPYWHEDKFIRAQRAWKAKEIVEQIIEQVPAIVPFSPIAYTHHLSVSMKNENWLERMDYKFLDACDCALFILMDGWTNSEGMNAEQSYCRNNEILYMNCTPGDVVNTCRKLERILKHGN